MTPRQPAPSQVPSPAIKLSRTARIARRLRRLWRRENGNATVEFAIVVPVTIMLFMASIESGLFMIRHVMLERGLDLVMRDFRLGRLTEASHDDIRNMICDNAGVLNNCEDDLKVWLQPISTTTWARPDTPAYCADRGGRLSNPPPGAIIHGGSNQVMLVRVCTLQTPIFPSTRFVARMRKDIPSGRFELATATIVINEPR